MKPTVVRAQAAAQILADNLGSLQHPSAGMLRLVQFAHKSDGVQMLATQIGEALVKTLEDRGWLLVDGPDEAQRWLESLGYEVKAPGGEGSAEGSPEGSREGSAETVSELAITA